MEREALAAGRNAVIAITDEIKKAVKGKDQVIERVMLAIMARGHILLEDIPGVGKTTLAMAVSGSMQLEYNRVQFTPDVMPSDVTGYTIYRKESDHFEYVKGAALCNLFLADEINRTSSKTQSALLEVMEEGRVTVDMQTHETPKPFIVIATQNPMGYAGTQMLPESQLDRFIVRLSMGYPDKSSELAILKTKTNQDSASSLVSPIVSAKGLMKIQAMVDEVFIQDEVYEYLISLSASTRSHELIELGASPRGTIALMRLAKARAFLKARDYVLPDDVREVAIPALAHRLILRPKARVTGFNAEGILRQLIDAVPPPKLKVKP